MNTLDILDTRTQTQLYETSFSGYERKKVQQLLEMAIYEGKLNEAICWMVELTAAGHFRDIWQICMLVFLRFVHLSSANLLPFLHQRWQRYKEIVGTDKKTLGLRNHPEIRILFYELVGVLTRIPKQSELVSFYKYKITQFDFDSAANEDKYQATEDYLAGIFMEADPLELYLPLNEFYYHLKVTQNKVEIYYWLDFLLEYYTKNKELKCFQKQHYLNSEMIWLIWSILKKILAEKSRLKMAEQLQSLYETCRKKRQPFPVFYYFLVELAICPAKLSAHALPPLLDLPSEWMTEAYMKIKENEIMTGTMNKEKMAILWE